MGFMVTDAVKLGVLAAGADLSAKQYYAVKVSSGAIVLAGDGEQAIGSLQNKPESGRPAEIQIGGVAKYVAGAAITVDAQVASDAAGKVITATTSEFVIGIALKAAGASGDVIPVLMLTRGRLDAVDDPRNTRESTTFLMIGAITAVADTGGAWEAPAAGEIVRVCAYRLTAGSAGATIVDIHIAGTTVFTTQGNRPEIAWDEGTKKDVATGAAIEAGTFAAGDIITMDVDQVDSAGSPADLTVTVAVEFSA